MRDKPNKRSDAERASSELQRDAKEVESRLGSWKPRTELGRKVKSGEIKDIKDALKFGKPILEEEIVLTLIPNLRSDLILIGQAKGKFGGGKRRAFRQTQKKMEEGSRISFSTVAVVGNGDGYIGIGFGKSKETIPAREKAIRSARLGIMNVLRGSGSWEGGHDEPNSIPFAVKGKCGSIEMILRPAPKGTGLIIEKECQKILKLAGIKDIWSKTYGQTKIKINLVRACEDALRQLSSTKIQHRHISELKIVDGKIGGDKI